MTIAILKKSYVRRQLGPEISTRLAESSLAKPTAAPDDIGAFRTNLWRNPSILLSSLGINIISLALPLVMLQVYERIIPNAALDTFAYLLFGLALVILLDGLLRMARSYSIAWQGSRFEHAMGRQTVSRLTETSLHDFSQEPIGRHLEHLQALDILRDFYGGSGLVNLLEAPFVLLFLVMIFLISGPLGLVPLTLFVASGALAVIVGRKVKSQITKRNKLDVQRYNFILEVLNGLQHVKSQAFEGFMLRRYERLQSSSAIENSELARLSALSHSCGAFFSYFVLFATAAAGAYMVIDGTLGQGALAASSLLAGRATQPFIRSMSFWTEYQSVRVAKSNLDHILAYTPEAASTLAVGQKIGGRITLSGVSKVYDEKTVIQPLNVTIEPGEFALVDGAIGSGKSTVLRMIAGLSAPNTGEIRFDGVAISDIPPADVRRQVAYLPEHAVLFRGTILENLTLFQPEAHLDRAMELCTALKLDHAIAKLPDGFETEVGDDLADLLPLGVRQQIGIVRALARRPKVILFDQPNRGLDMEADQRLADLIASMKGVTTIVMVTPRASYRRMVDRVILLGREATPTLHAKLPNAVRARIEQASPGLKISALKDRDRTSARQAESA